MKNREHILDRLFRSGADPSSTSEMPFGFDTRVLALARQSLPNGSAIIGVLAQRAAIISLVIIVLAGAGVYRKSISDNDLPTEYAMADRLIQNDLGE